MRRTYLDTGVLIEAAAGKGTRAEAALGLLKDSNRVFLSSPFLDLELLPQVIQNRQREQQKFLETYLAATKRIEDLRAIFRVAFREASSSAVSGMDALHVAAAHLLKADEFITTEKPGKAIYRNGLVHVLHLEA
jgi:predicted nucleic acid-binding protein